MSTLFQEAAERYRNHNAPLADRMRPRTLDEFVGQPHILGRGKLLRRASEADRVTSLIFFGPPGTGKTTRARILANTPRAHIASLNPVLAGVEETRESTGGRRGRLEPQQR